ncbi:hypothetical protein GRS48_07215 [Halorubrum sp. JWXQ-INN 858]|uniref:DUF6517 family protein n=1 Tax=Halorubrum sp. JWXQ-INN 858 TaxID=2690782 RepID=UPI00135CE8F0|nr:DUF6517 family protein [Halorubrum sp. JWXQ-INN 858]MWV64615.1 hypothetical protein [Halorubrum sp. JWXQ-INN 858]
MDRRTFLATTGTGSAVLLSGCSSPPREDDASEGEHFEAPTVRHDLTVWEETDTSRDVFNESLPLVDIEGYNHLEIYEDAALRRELSEGTMGSFDETVRVFAAGKINLVPGIDTLPFGLGSGTVLDAIESEAREEFVREMESHGLRSVTVTRTGTDEMSRGQEFRVTEFRSEFRYDGMRFPVEGMNDIHVAGGQLPVAGTLAVWHDGTDALVAGGAYPDERFEESIRNELTDLISVTVDVDLGFDPRRFEAELETLIESVR